MLSFSGQTPDGPLQIRYREGGEVMSLPDRGHRDLKRLLNERGVPGFVRGRLPLLYRGEQLLAVANLRGLNGSAAGRLEFALAATERRSRFELKGAFR